MAPPFPSPVERTVASSLLLLSAANQPPSLSSPLFDVGELLLQSKSSGDEECVSLVSSAGSKRCTSSVASEDASSHERRARKPRVIAVLHRRHEMKLKVIRKSRSNIIRKLKAIKPPQRRCRPRRRRFHQDPCQQRLDRACQAARARSRYMSSDEITKTVAAREKPRGKNVGGNASSHIQRRAEDILKLLSSGGCSSEFKIRRVLGDSPDTSKALRMLSKRDEVKRSGIGGRQDPYIYMVA